MENKKYKMTNKISNCYNEKGKLKYARKYVCYYTKRCEAQDIGRKFNLCKLEMEIKK